MQAEQHQQKGTIHIMEWATANWHKQLKLFNLLRNNMEWKLERFQQCNLITAVLSDLQFILIQFAELTCLKNIGNLIQFFARAVKQALIFWQ